MDLLHATAHEFKTQTVFLVWDSLKLDEDDLVEMARQAGGVIVYEDTLVTLQKPVEENNGLSKSEALASLIQSYEHRETIFLLSKESPLVDGIRPPFNSRVFLLSGLEDLKKGNKTTLEHLRYAHGRTRLINPVARWHLDEGLSLVRPFLQDRRFDMREVTMTVRTKTEQNDIVMFNYSFYSKQGVLKHTPPNTYLPDDWANGSHGVSGNCFDMVLILQDILGFKIEYRPSIDGFWGALVGNNGTHPIWSGMVGMVERGEVDVIASPITLTMDRAKVIWKGQSTRLTPYGLLGLHTSSIE